MSEALEIGTQLVTLFNQGKVDQCVEDLYGNDIVSIEPFGSDEMPARMEGLEAVKGKGEWWFANNEVHSMTAAGPFVGGQADKFAVQFDLDVTPKGGERAQMTEVGIYTVREGKVVEEEFWPKMG